jgi:hypothetical protein
MKKEHANKIQSDKNSSLGLFKGYFASSQPSTNSPHHTWTESSDYDGSECPFCFGTLDENGVCPDCNEMGDMDPNPFPMSLLYPGSEVGSEITADTYDDEDEWEDHPDEEDEFNEQGQQGDYWDGETYMYDPSDMHVPIAHQHYNSHPSQAYRGHTGSFNNHRRRSYSSSIPEYQESDMGILEEEDEETEGDGSSITTSSSDLQMPVQDPMTGVSIDSSQSGSSIYSSARSTPTSQPPGDSSRDSSMARRRRRTDSNTPTPSMTQPNRRRRIRGPSHSTSASRTSSQASNSSRGGFDSRQETWPEMIVRQSGPIQSDPNWDFSSVSQHSMGDGEEDEEDMSGDGSDGSRTTVGWDPNTNSNIRSRTHGSLTPTADQSHPTVHTRNPRPELNNRRIRRRTSALSTATSNREENDEDISDDTDVSSRTPRHGQRTNPRQRSIDPHIQSLFAGMRQLTNTDTGLHGTHLDHLRHSNSTPIARPRTSNRTRSNTPSGQQNLAGRMTPSSRSNMSNIGGRHGIANAFDEPPPETHHSQHLVGSSFYPMQPVMTSYADPISRPESRVNHRPPSASGRRNSGQWVNARSSNRNNPFIRPRQSNRSLREQSSVATLRSASSIRTLRGQSSRVGMRNNAHSPQSSRTPVRQHQTPRGLPVNDPTLPVRHSLNHTPSVMHLPQSIGQATQLQAAFRSPQTIHVPQLRELRDARTMNGGNLGSQPRNQQSENESMRRIQQVMDERREAIARRRESSSGAEDSTSNTRWVSGQSIQSSAPSNPFMNQGYSGTQGLPHVRGPSLASVSASHRISNPSVRSPHNASMGMVAALNINNPSSPSQLRRLNGQNAALAPPPTLDERDRRISYGASTPTTGGLRGIRTSRNSSALAEAVRAG